MFLSDLPKPIGDFLHATDIHDSKALLATLAPDAVINDEGKDIRGAAIREWNNKLYIGRKVVVHPIHIEQRDGEIVLAIALDGDYAAFGITEPLQFDWHIKIGNDRITALRMVETQLALPRPVARFVKALNIYDCERAIATFVEDALVNDQQREHAGRDAIRYWLDKEIIGDKVTMYVTQTLVHAGGVAITAKVTGAYDKTGLPDPLTLRFYFALREGAIAQLIIIPVKPTAA
jgi:ketosteroid isomerase-like protein